MEQALSALIKALSSWKRETAEAASKTETRLLRSLEALEARLGQDQLKAATTKELFKDLSDSFLRAVEQQQEEIQIRAEKSESRLQQRLIELSASIDEYKAQVDETTAKSAAGMVSGVTALEDRIHEMEVTTSESVKHLEEIENRLSAKLEDVERKASENQQAAAENWERLLRGLELLDERFSEKQQAMSERVESAVSSVPSKLEEWRVDAQQAAKEAQAQWLTRLEEIDTKLSTRLEGLERKAFEAQQLEAESRGRLLRGLEVLDARLSEKQQAMSERVESAVSSVPSKLEEWRADAQHAAQEAQAQWLTRLEEIENRLSTSLEGLERKASETQRVDADNWERLLRGLEILDARLSEKQQVMSESVESAVSSVPSKLEEWRDEAQEAAKEAQAQWLTRLDAIETGFSSMLQELERKASEARRSEAENLEGLLRGLELLDARLSQKHRELFERLERAVSVLPDNLEGLEQTVSETQRAEAENWERLLRGLELLDARFSEKQDAVSERLESAVSALFRTSEHQIEMATNIKAAVNSMSDAMKQWKAEVQHREETMVALILSGGLSRLELEPDQPPKA